MDSRRVAQKSDKCTVPGTGDPGPDEASVEGQGALRLHAGIAAIAVVLTAFVIWIFVRLGPVPLAVGSGVVATISLVNLGWALYQAGAPTTRPEGRHLCRAPGTKKLIEDAANQVLHAGLDTPVTFQFQHAGKLTLPRVSLLYTRPICGGLRNLWGYLFTARVGTTGRDVMSARGMSQRCGSDAHRLCVVEEAAGLSARTVRRRLSSVSGLFAYLLARGDLSANPVPTGYRPLRVRDTLF